MIALPDHLWRCNDCGKEFYACQKDLPPSILIQCPQCGSRNLSGGPIIQGGPFDEESIRQY